MKLGYKLTIVIGFLLALAAFYSYRSLSSAAEPQPNQEPTAENKAHPPAAPAVKLDCAGCHGPGKTLPYLAGEQFHKDAHGGILSSVHAKIMENGKPAAACADCHTRKGDMTTILPSTDARSTVNRANLTETCGACHRDAVTTFHTSIHGNLRDGGNAKAASCADCHGAHDILSSKNPDSTMYRRHAQEMCAKCHTQVVPDYDRSSHGVALAEGKDKAPACTDCHTAVSHVVAPMSKRDFNLSMIDNCSKCHEQQAPSYRDTFHGQATALGFKPAATCADCHTPHKNLPPSDPASSVHKNNLVQTCAACHKDANPGFATYNPHPEPTNPEKGYATYLVYTFMSWLLVGVFSFFGLHTILWFQRSVVDYIARRKEREEAEEDEQYVVRFSREHRLTHLLIIISFLGLAATGLPLMYYFTDWGKWLVGLHGGLEWTRYLHRVCAGITVVYALYHLFFIVRKAILARNFALLYGPDSMTIRPQDFSDALGMFRWFLYLGPKPKLDRWTYWEKFDYFAVFWGVPVIGFSGLMLWFPAFFTQFLPGEALNIAKIVHSEEALLATAFIFAFHFFHNHLRPENFPMDLVMFTGKMRLSTFREERPSEYQRLVDEGALESIIVPPPSRRFKFFARIFGFAAYLTGLFLVIMIFVTLLTGRH